MDFTVLKQNILDVIKESQMKIGYTPNAVRLYYPADTLCQMLAVPADGLTDALTAFCDAVPMLGNVTAKPSGDRWCITVPPEGAAYVRDEVPEPAFLADLLALLGSHRHDIGIDDVRAVFDRHSDRVGCRSFPDEEEFQYVLWFEDGVPDRYRYCIDIDLGHVTYHRLSPADYDALGLPPL